MTIEFKTHGKDLRYRFGAASIREHILRVWPSTEKFVFDFGGVETVHKTFADECFAKLLLNFEMEEIKEKSTFQNASPFIKQVIANAFKERMQSMADEAGKDTPLYLGFSDFTGE